MKPPSLEELIASIEARARGALHAARAFARALAGKPHSPHEPQLPDSYGETRLVLTAVDPKLVHAYWDLPVGAASDLSTSHPVLRFHDGDSTFDVDIDLDTRSRFIPLWSAGKRYFAELGLKSMAGEFASLARSNIVQMAPALPQAALGGERFVRVEPPRAPAVEVARVEPQAPPQPVDSAETLRRNLEGLTEYREPQAEPLKPRETARPETRPPQTGRLYSDLTEMAEQRLPTGISSQP